MLTEHALAHTVLQGLRRMVLQERVSAGRIFTSSSMR